MSGTITETTGTDIAPNTDYAEIYIGNNVGIFNVSGGSVHADFAFLGPNGNLATLGAPFFEGSVSNFQAGVSVLLEDVPNWTSFYYDPVAESLNFNAAGSVLASLTVSEPLFGQYTTASFSVVQQGGGFNTITVSTPPPVLSVAIATTYHEATVTAGPGQEHVVAPGIDTHTLLGQSMQFTDGTLAFDRAAFETPNSQLPMIYRLYETALGRAPDQPGENFWNAVLNHGGTPIQLAADFLGSPEYSARFGGLGNADFVTQLYQGGLGRAPETAGFNFWTGLLNAGASRADILLDIVKSVETINHNAAVASAGIFTPTV